MPHKVAMFKNSKGEREVLTSGAWKALQSSAHATLHGTSVSSTSRKDGKNAT